VITESRAYGRLMAGVLFPFLLLSDWVILNGPLLAVRRGLLAALALAAVPYVLRHRREVVRIASKQPLVFFAGFLAAGLAVSPFALAPAGAAVHTLVFAGVMLFAIAAAQTVSLRATLALLRLALALKLVASLLFGLVGPKAGPVIASLANGTLNQRHVFGGLFGNPNPLCEAAAAYLLLAVCHLIEQRRQWPAGPRGWLAASWYALTIPVSAFLMWQSLSRTAWISQAIVVVAIGAIGLWHTVGTSLSCRRRVALILGSVLAAAAATFALLLWLDISRNIAKPVGAAAQHIWQPIASGKILDNGGRNPYWNVAVTHIREKPWTGYGMSGTPDVFAKLAGPAREHAHNLELEAALYAGIPAALLIVLFVATSLGAAARAFLDRRPLALSVVAALFLFFLMAQVDPVVFGSPYPSLLIVLTLTAHLQRPRDAAGRAVVLGDQAAARAARDSHT
jgi:O-antigen ligase